MATKAILFLRRAHTELDRRTIAEVLQNQVRNRISIVNDDDSGHLKTPS
jgi:hypothetical protein